MQYFSPFFDILPDFLLNAQFLFLIFVNSTKFYLGIAAPVQTHTCVRYIAGLDRRDAHAFFARRFRPPRRGVARCISEFWHLLQGKHKNTGPRHLPRACVSHIRYPVGAVARRKISPDSVSFSIKSHKGSVVRRCPAPSWPRPPA